MKGGIEMNNPILEELFGKEADKEDYVEEILVTGSPFDPVKKIATILNEAHDTENRYSNYISLPSNKIIDKITAVYLLDFLASGDINAGLEESDSL